MLKQTNIMNCKSGVGAHRYWRIVSPIAPPGGNLAFVEIEMRASAGGADQCNGGTAIYGGGSLLTGLELLVDNTTSPAALYTAVAGCYYGYDFGSPVTVAEILFIQWDSAGQPAEYKVEYSDDNSLWITAAHYTTIPYSSGNDPLFGTTNKWGYLYV